MPNGHILSFGPYQLDTEKVRLWCDTQVVRLTPKAFQVLCYVVERPGQLVTKEELFRVVWADTVVGDAALTVCIQEIRKALQDNAKSPQYLETVHRQGFRFIAVVMAAPVPSSELQVPSQEEEQQQERSESDLAFRIQSRESEPPNVSLPSDQTLDPRPQIPDDSASTRFWSRKSLMLTSLLLLIIIIIAVQYLSLPTPTPQALLPSTQPLTLSTQSLPLPDKPSIIVLPFVNLSGDLGQEYFSDGMTEEITAALSRLSSLFVIARTSAFTYKGKGAKVQDISREMGVRYVLEGSARRTNEQVRIIVQLIDATTGEHLWSERYDRALTDIFAVQDEIVQKIVITLKLQLAAHEHGLLVHKRTENLEAYDAWLRGVEYFIRFTKEANVQAQQLFEQAIALDPQYADAYAWLGMTYWIRWNWRWSTDAQTLDRAFALAQQAVTLDDSLSSAHSLLSIVYGWRHQYEQAITEGERAVALDPNNAQSYFLLGEVLNSAGRPEEALKMMKQVRRLNPRHPPSYLINVGWSYNLTGRYAEAVVTLKELMRRIPNHLSAPILLTDSYLGQWSSQQGADAQTLEHALAAAHRAITLNDAHYYGHRALGTVYLWQKQYEQAIAEMEQAIALDSDRAGNYAVLAETLSRIGRVNEAVGMVEQALHRKPLVMDEHLSSVGAAYYLAGKPEEAVALLKQYIARYPNVLRTHLHLAAVYSELGQIAEARAAAAGVLRINPKFSLEVHKERVPIKDPAMLERHIAALRKAGLK